MPIYTYKCQSCGNEADKLRKVLERDEPILCSKCGGNSVHITAVPSPPKFNGKGWTEKFHGMGGNRS